MPDQRKWKDTSIVRTGKPACDQVVKSLCDTLRLENHMMGNIIPSEGKKQ